MKSNLFYFFLSKQLEIKILCSNLNTNISTKTKSNKMNESLQYSLKLEAPKVENLFQLRSSTMPNWFPGLLAF